MKKHVDFLGLLYIVFNALTILTAIIVFLVLSGVGFFADALTGPEIVYHSCSLATLTTSIGMIIAFFLLLFSIPGIIGGIGLLKMRPWARLLVLILGCINLINIPFGTILGIYTIWVLMQDEIITMFSTQEANIKK